ncbi:MAG: hypothetical protein WC222_06395 [Parachlamydiales bacterium]|jgi:hypothetical protein
MSIDPTKPSATNTGSNAVPSEAATTPSSSSSSVPSTPSSPPSTPSSAPLTNDTLQSGKNTSKSPTSPIAAQTPQLTDIEYQKFIGDVSKEFKQLLQQLELLDNINSKQLNSLFASMAVLALKNYRESKSKIIIPPASGTPGGNTPPGSPAAPGGSSPGTSGPPGTAPYVNPYASINKDYAKQMQEISDGRLAIANYSEYLSKYGLGALAFKSLQLTQDPEDLHQQSFALDQQKLSTTKNSSPTETFTVENEEKNGLKTLFNSELIKSLEPLIGPENAQRASDLSHILTVQLLSLQGLSAGKDAIQLISTANTTDNTHFESPEADVAATVSLILNLSKFLTPEGGEKIKSVVETAFSEDPVLTQIPENGKNSTVKSLVNEIQTSILKVLFVEVETGLNIESGFYQLLEAFKVTDSTKAPDQEPYVFFELDTDDYNFIKPYVPSKMPNPMKQNPYLLVEKIYGSYPELSPADFTQELVKHILIAGVSSSIAYTQASQVTIAILAANQENYIGKIIDRAKIADLAEILSAALQSGAPLKENTELKENIKKSLIEDGETPDVAESFADQLLEQLETRFTPKKNTSETAASTSPLLSEESSLPKEQITTLSKEVHSNLVTLLKKVIAPSVAPKIASQILEIITGYSNADAISSDQSTNPHSIVNVAKDKITNAKNYYSIEDKQTSQNEKHVENFKDFISEHSDLTTFAEELRSPAKALIMTWGLMNEGTFKFSGKRNSIDFLG